MDRIPNRAELSPGEYDSLRLIVDQSFMSAGSLSKTMRTRLVELGLIQNSMGGVTPTPAGRIVARM